MKITNFAVGSVLAALSVLAGVSAASAHVVTGLGPFTASGPGASVSGDVLTYSASGFGPDTWTITATAAKEEVVTVNDDSKGFYSFYDVSASLSVFSGSVSKSVYSEGPANCCSAPSNGFDYSGSVSFKVDAGQTYGFSLTGSNFDSARALNGTFTLSLPVVTGVPEVSTWARMLAGFAGLGFVGYGRKNDVAAAA